MRKRFYLWVWKPYSRVKSGYQFDTRKEAEAYYQANFLNESVKHEITFEI